MRLRSFVSIILLLLASSARAAGIDITGVVVDTSGGSLPGVTVTVTPTGAGAASAEPTLQVTDGDGRFSFEGLNAGTYTVVFSLPGFDEKKVDAINVPATEPLKAVLSVAGVAETITVKASTPPSEIPREAIGESKMEEHVLTSVALPNDRFEEALPMLPGIVRGPDGLLNMNGTRADQSAVTLNGINMTDPVTNHFAVRLPLEAIESLNVHSGVYSAAFGNAAGGVTDIVTKSGEDKFRFQGQNFMPRLRFKEGVNGVDSFTPRVHFSGPIEKGKLWYSEAASFRFVRSRVDELEPLEQSEQKVKSFDAVSQIDYQMSSAQHVTGTFVLFPSNIDNVGIDTLHPFDATPDLKQRGWIGALGHRTVLSDNMTLSSAFAFKQFNMAFAPKHGEDTSFMTVAGLHQNYFNTFDRDSRRYDASSTLSISKPSAFGEHLIRVGGQIAHTSYDGIDNSSNVAITGASGQMVQQIEFVGASGVGGSASSVGGSSVGATNTEISGFVEDHWEINRFITLNGGVRYAYEHVVSEHTIAPRADISVRPFEHGKTVIKAGVGRFYDALPLNAVDFSTQQSRRVTEYDAEGGIAKSTLYVNRIAAGGLQMPVSTAWNAEVDQMLSPNWLARVGYRETKGSNQLIVDPMTDPLAADGVMLLSNGGRSRSREFEVTVKRQFADAGHVTASYVRSRTRGDLNDFVSIYGDLREPIVYANAYAPQSFDTPNRFLIFGVVNLPKKFTVAPTLEYRNGFPYSVVDERQDVVGTRNQNHRYPDLMTLDLAVTKDMQLMHRRVRVGVQVFNLTNHFNPQDVQNNLASPYFGDYSNGIGRQVRAKFVLLF
jgi:hypothetical protein